MTVSINRFPRRAVSDYAAIRQQIRSGDILMCSGTAWFSKLIQRASDSVWSHVAFVMRLPEIDRVVVLESIESAGVRAIPLSRYLSDYAGDGKPYKGGVVLARHAGFARKANSGSLKKFGQFAVDQFGYPYDRNEIAKIAARISSRKIGFDARERRQLKRDKEYICSEYVWECFRAVNIDVAHDRGGFITPADFARDPHMQLLHVLQKRP